MGRAIVRDPAAFLMDEPLSNLDAKLRVQMRTEVARLQQQLGTTTIYVTHDQTEAMTLGDRVAVMRSGVVQQVGAPMELYNEPVNLFVAGFIGSPAMNFMPATVEGDTVKLPFGDVRLPPELHDRVRHGEGRQLIAGIRPEHFEDAKLVGDAQDRGTTFSAKIEVVESLGSELYAHFTVASDADDRVRRAARAGAGRGRRRGPERGRGAASSRGSTRPPRSAGPGGRAVGGRHPAPAVRPRGRAQPDGGCRRAGGGGRGGGRRAARDGRRGARYFNSRRSFLTIVSSS